MSTKQFSTQLLLTFLFAALLFMGCHEKNGAAQQKDPASKMQKPKTDFHTAVVRGNIDAGKQPVAAGTDFRPGVVVLCVSIFSLLSLALCRGLGCHATC